MFDRDRFLADCEAAVAATDSHLAVKQLVERAVSDPAGMVRALGEPTRGGVQRLHVSDTLTVLNLVWAPEMMVVPHNHNMWAVIGIYGGRENNLFWRRIPDDPHGRVEAAGAKSLGAGEVAPLGRDVIHTVVNPLRQCTAAIHVYGGGFFTEPRQEWDPETLVEGPMDLARTIRSFEEANARLASHS
jgi:predicted metal-dependent enzyme (double-stranded beta helix superfamily)